MMPPDCPPPSQPSFEPPSAALEDRRRRAARRAQTGELLLRGTRRRAPESLGTVVAVDKRTRLGRVLANFRAGLIRHAGGTPSETQAALIEVACQLKARLALMDASFVAIGTVSGHDSRQYLAWSNSLSRTLKLLGLKGAPKRVPSLAEYIAGRAADGAPAASQPRPVSPHGRTPQAAGRPENGGGDAC